MNAQTAVVEDSLGICGDCGLSHSLSDLNFSLATGGKVCLDCADKAARRQSVKNQRLSNRQHPFTARRHGSSNVIHSLTETQKGRKKPHSLSETDELLRLASLGQLEPVAVDLPLPADTPAMARRVADYFCHVHGVRKAGCNDQPVMFGVDWVAERTGIHRSTVHRAIRWLVDNKVLRLAETLPGRAGPDGNVKRGLHAYLPGEGRLRRVK